MSECRESLDIEVELVVACPGAGPEADVHDGSGVLQFADGRQAAKQAVEDVGEMIFYFT